MGWDEDVFNNMIYKNIYQGNWRTHRHDALCDVFLHALALSVNNANCRRELCSIDFEQGSPTYFEVSVRNSFQPQYVVQAAQYAGVAAEAGEKEKTAYMKVS